jgi:peptidoglycan hydrolase-like protein with peptidoglycan-binding domain
VSSHFGILEDGTIEQYVNTALESWAQAEGNASYLSVETVGEPTTPLTVQQVDSFGKLMEWAHTAHAVELVITDTPGQPGLIGHGDGGVAWGNHEGCPGELRLAQRAEILQIAGATDVQQPPATEPPATTEPPTTTEPAPAPAPTTDGEFMPPTVQIGDLSGAVRSAQALLDLHVPLTLDGDFGAQTEQAVKNFQTVMHLDVDGIVGPQTWTALCAFG